MRGKQWWLEAEEPWQALACICELGRASLLDDPRDPYVLCRCTWTVRATGCSTTRRSGGIGKAGSRSISVWKSTLSLGMNLEPCV